MAETLISPGVSARENDQSFVTSQPVERGAAIIGPTVLGPVERPTLISSFSSYQALFGGATKMLPANIIKGAAVTKPGIFGKAASMFGNLSTGTKLGLGGAFASYLASTGASEEDVEEIKRDKLPAI